MSYEQHHSPEHEQAKQMTDQLTGMGKKASNSKAGRAVKKAGKEAGKKIGKKLMKMGAKALKKVAMAVAKALAKALVLFIKPILIILAVVLVILAIWWVVYEIRGTDQDYALDAKTATVQYDEETGKFKESDEYIGQNKAIKEFYNYFGTKRSHWQIEGNDNTKLIPGDDENAVQDYYHKESQYSINPNFLFALDEYAYEGKYLFPEQFVEPVKYNPDKLKLEQLTDDEGLLTAKSTKYEKGLKTDEKIKGVWDYGFGTIFKYKKDRILRTVEGTYNFKDEWSETEKKIVQVPINEPFTEVLSGYPVSIDLMTNAITFTGDYTFQYEDKKSKLAGAEGELKAGNKSSKPNEAVNKIWVGTYDEYKDVPVYGMVPHEETSEYVVWEKRTRQIPVYGWVFIPYPHKDIIYYEEEEYYVQVTKTKTETVYNEEQIGTKKEFVKTHDLYKYRTGAVYETIPVEKPKTVTMTDEEKKKKEEEKLRYLEDYLFYFQSYVPKSVMDGFDFEGRVGQMIQTNMELGASTDFGNGNYAGAMQYADLVKFHASKYGIEPEAIIAMIAQETGGRANAEDGLMQITGNGKRCTGKPSTGPEVCVYSEADRRNPDKAIEWGVAYFATKLDKYNGDYLKAIQSHNLDPAWIFKTYPETAETLDWLNYREEMRIHYGQQAGYGLTKSANYDCIPGFDTASVQGRTTYGDVCYLEHVLRYYNGTMLAGVDKVDTPSQADENKNTVVNAIKSFFGISPKNYLEDEERFEFKNRVNEKEVERMMRAVKSFDGKIDYSKVEDLSEMEFWEKGGGDGSGSNLSKEEFLALIGDTKYAPPLDIPNPRVTTNYGEMGDGVHSTPHKGIDIGVPTGTALYAVQSGTIAVAVSDQTYSKQSWGNYVKIRLDDGNYVLYGHMSSLNVKVGDRVEMGDCIGYSGNSGNSTGPHLHFEFYYQSPEKSAIKDPTWIVLQPEIFNNSTPTTTK